MSSQLERAIYAAKCCLLPTLNIKIGDQQIEKDHFRDFQPILQNNLRFLLDIVLANETYLLEHDLNTRQLRTTLCLLLCEQSPITVFQVDSYRFQSSLINLSEKYFLFIIDDEEVLKEALDYYRQKLQPDSWKLNFGSVYGFVEFCERVFNVKRLCSININFLLSVSLIYLDHFEPEIQHLALKILKVMFNEKVMLILFLM